MCILFETIPAKNREFKTYENGLHRSMEAGAIPLGAYNKKLYPARLHHILALCSQTTILI